MSDDEKTTQDEIDRLLAEAGTAATPPVEPDTSEEGDSVEFSQDEIDRLLNSGDSNDPEPEAESSPETDAAPAATSMRDAGPAPAADAPPTPHAAEKLGDDIQLLIQQAEQAADSAAAPNDSGINAPQYQLPNFAGTAPSGEKATLELFRDVDLDLKIELGRTQMELEEVLKLQQGSVVTLEKLAGDPVDVYANGRLIARGEVLVLNDNFCVRIAELITAEEVS